MNVENRPPPTAETRAATRPDGNGVDFHYMERAHAALGPLMAASHAASIRAAGEKVRTLAREALSVQTSELAAIAVCLRGWDRVQATVSDAAETLPGLRGVALDRAFVVQLTAHAHASIAAARKEMLGGTSPRARGIAEDSIRSQSHQLAALEAMVTTAQQSPTPPARVPTS